MSVLLFIATNCIGATTVIRERTPSDAATLAPDQVDERLSLSGGGVSAVPGAVVVYDLFLKLV